MHMQRLIGRFAALAGLLLASQSAAQDTTRGVRIGLRYDPSTKPGIVVLPVSGVTGDSIRAIIERDFDYSDRLNVITISAADVQMMRGDSPSAGQQLNLAVFAKLGAAAVLQATPTAAGLHVALHDVGSKKVASVEDFGLPKPDYSPEWRQAVHRTSDEVERWITGQRGIAQTRIAFIRGNSIQLIDSDGRNEQTIPANGAPMSPAWHPGGNLLAYNTVGPDSRIVIHDLRTGRVRDFGARRNATHTTAAFTPDGRSLSFSVASETGTDVFLVPLDGDAQQRRLTIGRGSNNLQVSFSPDGNRIAFMSDRSGHPEVYIMDADGTNADIFTAFDFGDQNYRASPDWSPDGRQVTFQTRIDWRFQVFTMSLRDRQPKQLTSEGENEDPSWAPDGRHIVFSSTRSGTRQLWILDTESGRIRQLTQAGGSRLAAWSPRLTAK
jgi:TolB protein